VIWSLGWKLAVASILLPGPCMGLQLSPFTFEATARMAKLAFAGTVDRIEYRKGLTDVRFTDIRHARPSGHDKTVTLSLQGSFNMLVVEMPRFEVGQRYIVLAVDRGSPENWHIPLVGMRQGVFHVVRSEGRREGIVHDADGHPVLAVRGGHLAILDDTERGGEKGSIDVVPGVREGLKRASEPAFEIYPKELDPGTRVTEGEFLRAIQDLAK
jgi:hypothetical protein